MRAARLIRQKRGLTLREVERVTGIDRGNLSRFEQGRTGMLQDNLQVYARCLGVSVDALLEPADATHQPQPTTAEGQSPAQWITAADHPVLARVWDNESDAVFDTL